MKKTARKPMLVLIVSLLAALSIYYGASAIQSSIPEASPAASPAASPIASPVASPEATPEG